MPLFGGKKKFPSNKEITPMNRNFANELINDSPYANLTGQKREEMIQEITNQLHYTMVHKIGQHLTFEQNQEYARMLKERRPAREWQAYLRQHIPNYTLVIVRESYLDVIKQYSPSSIHLIDNFNWPDAKEE